MRIASLLAIALAATAACAQVISPDVIAVEGEEEWEDLTELASIAEHKNGNECTVYTCNYGELGQARVYSSMKTLSDSLEAMVEDPELFVPGSRWSKDARKYTERARDYLDLFCYAYPNGPSKKDMFLELRTVLSALHHDIGKFNDLTAHKHTEAELERFKVETKIAIQKFVAMISEPRWVDYLQHPLIGSFYQRPQAELSRLFWDTVPADLPSAKLTGLQNLAGLCQAYIDTVATSWDAIKDWNFKTLKRYHNDVHDVRKEIRAINYTSDFFPEVFKNQEHAQELKLALRQFYDVYSKVQSHLELYMYYVGKQMRKEALTQSQKMQAAWERLISWQNALNDDQRLPALLNTMRSNLISIPKTPSASMFPRWMRICFYISLPILLVLGAAYGYRSVRRDFAHGGGYELIQ